MPTYDYRCQSCGHELEAFQRMSEPPLVKCPECGKHRLERLLGAGAGIIFKGSGFYETDYKRGSASGGSAGKKTEEKKEKKETKEKSAGAGEASGGGECSKGAGSSG